MESSNLESEEKEEISKIKSIDLFDNLKNDYFLQEVFNHLEKKKLLKMIKYNRNIMERIDININDYKEYSEQYSSIELELKPVNEKYGSFIRINKEGEKFYHIYFNPNKKEIILKNMNK